jgi:hypothetical protein
MLTALRKESPAAARAAMVELIPKVQEGIKAQMIVDMDRPVPFSLGAVMTQINNKDGMGGGRVFIADRFRSGGADESHYLGVNTLGGVRDRRKASEIALQAMGIMPRGTVWVPDRAVRLDKNGNVPSKSLNAMLAEFRAYGKEPLKGRNFYVRGGTRYPAMGVFTRIGEEYYPFLWFVSPRRYAMLFDFYGRADKEASYWFAEIYDKQISLMLERVQ